ncbi:MAG: hypothetical protein DMF89_26270 [Acidobacteria bacterium]|nr:MAG: hypothetical protein DMF89_26270 [Acidobacteriota bacterium]
MLSRFTRPTWEGLMTTRRSLCTGLFVFLTIGVPAVVSAQTGSIAGVVKDTTGAVLPGVTVEATSPALIEKVRTVVTDGEGLYKIADLRPGDYAVTFTLPGFSTVRRDGIILSAGFTATVNAELRVGTVEETITVSGATPMVDVQNTRQQTVMNRDVIDSIPTGRNPASYAALVPGVIAAGSSGLSGQDVGGSTSDRTVFLIVHGSRGQASPLLYDGMRYNNMNGTPGGGHVIWAMNNAAVQEFVIETGSLSIMARACSPPGTYRIRPRPPRSRRTGTSTRRLGGPSRKTSCGFSARTGIGGFMSTRRARFRIPMPWTSCTRRTRRLTPSTKPRIRVSTSD